MAKPKKHTTKKNKLSQEVTFHYQKTSSYRSYHVDGAYGGLSPNGNLHIQPYVERAPIPKTETYKIQKGKLEIVSKVGKEGVIRDIECELIMDYGTMVVVHEWLGKKIDEFNEKFRPKNIN